MKQVFTTATGQASTASKLTSLSRGSPASDPDRVAGREVMLSRGQADGPNIVSEGHRTVQLHQGNVVVKRVSVVIGVWDDLLQVPLHNSFTILFLDMKAQIGLPGIRLGESVNTHINVNIVSKSDLLHQTVD